MTGTGASNGAGTVRVRVGRGREELRDYFLRLGARAAIDETGAVSVRLEDNDDGTVEEYLANWATINQINATIEPVARFLPLQPLRPRLGEVLTARGLITDAQLNEALAETAKSGELLGRVLLRRRWLFEDELAGALSEQLQIPYISIRSCGVDRGAARMVPAETGLRYAVIPLGFVADKLRVAFADPCDETASAAVSGYCSGYETVVAELSDIEAAWRGLAGPASAA